MKIDTAGTYTFALTSDDASKLEIDDDTIVDNEIKTANPAQAAQGLGQFLHAQESTGTVWLCKVCMHACMYACMRVCVYDDAHTHIHAYTHTL